MKSSLWGCQGWGGPGHTGVMSATLSSLESTIDPRTVRGCRELALQRAIAEGVAAGSVVGLVATALAFAIFHVTIGIVALPVGIALFVTAYVWPLTRGSRPRSTRRH